MRPSGLVRFCNLDLFSSYNIQSTFTPSPNTATTRIVASPLVSHSRHLATTQSFMATLHPFSAPGQRHRFSTQLPSSSRTQLAAD